MGNGSTPSVFATPAVGSGVGLLRGLTFDAHSHDSYLRLSAVGAALGRPRGLAIVTRDWVLEDVPESLAGRWKLVVEALQADGGWTLTLSQRDETPFRSGVWSGTSRRALRVGLSAAGVRATSYAEDDLQAESALGVLDSALAAARCPRVDQDQIPMMIWSRDGAGMEGRTCVVPCPSWEDIRSNYPGCSEGLDWLMGRRRPFDEGRIVFWHGASGTGKTFAIRALMRAWRRMSVELIVDPEAFLGSPQYLRELVAHRPRRGALLGRTPVGGSDKERGRLFVLEDAGSLLLDGSRFELGPSVARLLNLTDGLLGQGLRIVFLVTTNEPLGAIDPALTRPGRCLQALGFPTFDQEQARSWLESHGCADPVAPSGSTLADLYAQKHGRRHPGLGAEIAPLGFRM